MKLGITQYFQLISNSLHHQDLDRWIESELTFAGIAHNWWVGEAWEFLTVQGFRNLLGILDGSLLHITEDPSFFRVLFDYRSKSLLCNQKVKKRKAMCFYGTLKDQMLLCLCSSFYSDFCRLCETQIRWI